MPQINYNNKLSNIPASVRVSAVRQLRAEGVKQPSVAQITSKTLKLYAATKLEGSAITDDAEDDLDSYNATPEWHPNGFRSW